MSPSNQQIPPPMECHHCYGGCRGFLLPVAHGDLQQHNGEELGLCKPTGAPCLRTSPSPTLDTTGCAQS